MAHGGAVVGAGLSVSNAFGETRVVPLLSLQWETGAATIRVLAPAEASVALPLGDAVTAALRATLDGNVYTLGRRGILEDGVARGSGGTTSVAPEPGRSMVSRCSQTAPAATPTRIQESHGWASGQSGLMS